jgi:hypothetical protein
MDFTGKQRKNLVIEGVSYLGRLKEKVNPEDVVIYIV